MAGVTGSPANRALPSAGESTSTFSVTVPAGATALYVGMANVRFTPPRTVSSAPWNASALTLVAGSQQTTNASGSPYIDLEWWELLSPTPATGNEVVTWSGAARGSCVAVPVASSTSGTTAAVSGTSSGLAIATGASGLVLSLFATDEGDSTTIALTAGTSLFNFIGSAGAGGSSVRTGCAWQAGTGGSVSTTWTPTGSFAAVGHSVISILNAGGVSSWGELLSDQINRLVQP